MPAKLRALQCHGKVLRLFHYADDQMDLLTSFFFGAADYRIGRPNGGVERHRPDQVDPLLGPAKALAEAHGSVSLSLIQRTYAIGYSRAPALAEAIRQCNEEQSCA
jgi:DNA segregation ATPase FtsK/SpoIIIE-like protein